MRILRSLAVGIVAAALAAVLGTFVELALALSAISGQMTGGLGAVGWNMYFEYYALIGLIAGFYWHFRRSRRKQLAAVSNSPPSL